MNDGNNDDGCNTAQARCVILRRGHKDLTERFAVRMAAVYKGYSRIHTQAKVCSNMKNPVISKEVCCDVTVEFYCTKLSK